MMDDHTIVTTLTMGAANGVDPWQTLVSQYRIARQAWKDNPGVQAMAQTLQMSEREYCDRYRQLNYPPRVTTTATSGILNNTAWKPLEQAMYDRAFEEARVR